MALGDGVAKIVLKKVRNTRWESRHNAVFALKYRYRHVLKSLTNIMLTSDTKEKINKAKGLTKKLKFVWVCVNT